MRKITLCTSVSFCVVFLVGALLTDAFAGVSKGSANRGQAGKYAPRDSKDAVAIAGTVSGSLRGRQRIGGRDVMITEHTNVYKTGEGMIDRGRFLANAPVYVIGVAKDGVVYAQLVIVSDSKQPGKVEPVRVVGPDEPQ